MKAVMDTNVIVSALLVPSGISGGILFSFLNRKFTLVYDNRILAEYIEVCKEGRLKINQELIGPIIDFIKKEAFFCPSTSVAKPFVDEGNKKFYEVFISSGADYLITGNLKHFPKDNRIVSPREFLGVLY